MERDSTDNAQMWQPLTQGEEEEEEAVDMMTLESNDDVTVQNGDSKESLWFQVASMFAFTINYIFGAGVLGVPYAVAHGGILVSAVVLIFSSGLCLCAMLWILESQERAKFLLGTTNMVDYSEICRLFLGTRVQRIYEVAVTVFVICSAWMYASILSVSISKVIPIFSNATECDLSSQTGPLWNATTSCWIDYLIYLTAFTAIMTFVVRMEVSAMKSLQLGLTCIGLTAVVTMLITVAAALPEHVAKLDNSTKYFNAANFGGVFGTFVFAQLCHHGIPLLSEIPQRKDIIRPVFVGVVMTTTSLYLGLGVLCAVFFGIDDMSDNPKAINKLITLNWQEYTAGKLKAGFFAEVISLYVRLYPAVTCGAAFPLYIITLGNVCYQAYYGDSVGHATVSKDRFYLGAMIPAVLFAAFMADISFMLFFVGISAFVIAFFIPPMMQIQSKRMVPQMEITAYSGHISRDIYCHICLVFATFALLYTLYNQFF